MTKKRTHNSQSEYSSSIPPAQPSKPSDEIIRILNLLRDRITKLLTARNEKEFNRLQESVNSRLDLEWLLDENFQYPGIEEDRPLHEIFRRECVDGGSPDEVACSVMRGVEAAIEQARQAAQDIRAPELGFAGTWEEWRVRENKKAANQSDDILLHAIVAVQDCAAGKPAVSDSRIVHKGDGPQSEDCRLFRVRDETLSLSTTQAAVVSVFWNAHKNGENEISKARALTEADVKSERIRDLFKKRVKGKSVTDPNYFKLFKLGSRKGMLSLNLSELVIGM
jgi:hypothetical protein